jgi:hypothetical protein
MDVRDFIQALPFQILSSIDNSIIVTRGESSVDLVPGVSINPVVAPMSPAEFQLFTGRPSLISFDIDLSARQMLLHFDGLMDINTLDLTRLSLNVGTTDNGAALSSTISRVDRYVTTVCVALSTADFILVASACATTCSCSTAAGLIRDYNSNFVQLVNLMQVFCSA